MQHPSRKRLILSILLILLLSVIELLRLCRVPVTWDEGLTYVKHVERIFYPTDRSALIQYFLHMPNAGNNHLLNTLLIGIFTRLTGLRYSVFVLRLPVLIFFAIYLFLVIGEFLRARISWIGLFLLLCCPYLDEFFALSRGYAISASLVFLTMLFFRRWLRAGKDSDLLLTAATILLAESANTAALLISGPLCILILIKLIISRDVRGILLRKGAAAVLFALSQAFVLLYHLYVSRIDLLYADRSGSLLKLLRRYVELPASLKGIYAVPLLLLILFVLLACNCWLLYRKKAVPGDYPGAAVFILYLLLCTAAAEITKGGYPIGRVLLIAYPVFALSLEELIRPLPAMMDQRTGKKSYSVLLQAFLCALLLLSLLLHTDTGRSTDWPDAGKYRELSYAAYEAGRPLTQEDYGANPDACRFWRGKILYEHGFDIFDENRDIAVFACFGKPN